jgi:hypothetical protein
LFLSIFFFNNAGVRCQEETEASGQETACNELCRVDNSTKKADGFLFSVIGLLTPDTIDIVLFKELN